MRKIQLLLLLLLASIGLWARKAPVPTQFPAWYYAKDTKCSAEVEPERINAVGITRGYIQEGSYFQVDTIVVDDEGYPWGYISNPGIYHWVRLVSGIYYQKQAPDRSDSSVVVWGQTHPALYRCLKNVVVHSQPSATSKRIRSLKSVKDEYCMIDSLVTGRDGQLWGRCSDGGWVSMKNLGYYTIRPNKAKQDPWIYTVGNGWVKKHSTLCWIVVIVLGLVLLFRLWFRTFSTIHVALSLYLPCLFPAIVVSVCWWWMDINLDLTPDIEVLKRILILYGCFFLMSLGIYLYKRRNHRYLYILTIIVTIWMVLVYFLYDRFSFWTPFCHFFSWRGFLMVFGFVETLIYAPLLIELVGNIDLGGVADKIAFARHEAAISAMETTRRVVAESRRQRIREQQREDSLRKEIEGRGGGRCGSCSYYDGTHCHHHDINVSSNGSCGDFS